MREKAPRSPARTSAFSSFSRAAKKSSASSQVIRLNLPSPRAPVRNMGCFNRSGS